MNDRVKRTAAKALTVATTLAVAGAVAGAGTLGAATDATSPAALPVAYPVTPVVADDAAALAARTQERSTFAERASRDAAIRQAARAKALKAAKAKAARAKALAAKREAAAAKKRSRATMYSAPVASGSARAIGKRMAAQRGWTGNQWAALDRLWAAESGWQVTAGNASGAYGIPQALPGSKMSSAGPNWQTSASTQISWGLSYIASRWGSPMNAWNQFQSSHWY